MPGGNGSGGYSRFSTAKEVWPLAPAYPLMNSNIKHIENLSGVGLGIILPVSIFLCTRPDARIQLPNGINSHGNPLVFNLLDKLHHLSPSNAFNASCAVKDAISSFASRLVWSVIFPWIETVPVSDIEM